MKKPQEKFSLDVQPILGCFGLEGEGPINLLYQSLITMQSLI